MKLFNIFAGRKQYHIKKGNTMKKALLLFTAVFVFFSLNTVAQHNHDHEGHDHGHNHELKWHTNLEEAQKEAAKTGKPIFADFTGSDWCGWCIKLHKEVLSKKEFIEYAAHNLVLLEIDFPKRKKQDADVKQYNEKLMRKYGVRGFPTILLLDKDGKVINQTGYQDGGPVKYVEHLEKMLAKK